MAFRDRSQGFGFMYVNLAKILQERDERQDAAVLTNNVKTVNFNKDKTPAPVPSPTDRTTAVEQVKQNLDRLQSLHHRLHTILDELNQLTNKEKK